MLVIVLNGKTCQILGKVPQNKKRIYIFRGRRRGSIGRALASGAVPSPCLAGLIPLL